MNSMNPLFNPEPIQDELEPIADELDYNKSDSSIRSNVSFTSLFFLIFINLYFQ